MSKKIAEGTGALVLDVKVGTGAFMKDLDRARELAATMVALGKDAGVHTVALLTDMSTPLGRTAGNAIEVRESVEVLAGGGPADVVELTLALAREMLAGAGRDDVDPADKLATGGDGRVAADDLGAGRRPATPAADRPGDATSSTPRRPAYSPGWTRWPSGSPPGDSVPAVPSRAPVQAGAGVELHARPGDPVTEGQPLLTLHTDEPDRFERALASLEGGYDVAAAVRRTSRRRSCWTGSAEERARIGSCKQQRRPSRPRRPACPRPRSRRRSFSVSCLPAGTSVTSPIEHVARTRAPTGTGLGKRTLLTP